MSEPSKPSNMRMVVTASAAGTAFEWYDFFVFVPLATIIAKTFAAGLNESAGYVFALGSFAAGFAFRPVGALIFGRIGDRVGRKATFLATIGLMGVATFAIGLLPTYAQAGVIAPILFVTLRILQGIALGGEWGGAAIYIAEHGSPQKRGSMTSWLGASAAFGLGGALIVVLTTRAILGEPAFTEWGWRIPFLISALLFGLSVWIRLKLSESPTFQKMKAEGARSKAPLAESFLRWPSLKLVLIALFSLMIAQGAVWYTTFFYAQFFLERVIKVPPELVNGLMIAVVVASAPLYIVFGKLSDKVGRKPVVLGGMILFAVGLFASFQLMTRLANPELARASVSAPVTIVADPADCSVQFDPIGKTQFRSSCDIIKSLVTSSGAPYRNVAAPAGTLAEAHVGQVRVASADGSALSTADLAAAKAEVGGRLKTALTAAGYPVQANPTLPDLVGVFAVMMVLAVGATALYGPQAAALVEMFPTRIRYTALSLPYHIGTGWVGGFLPATAYAMVVTTGDIYFGLWYPLVATVIAILVTFFFLKETRGRDLDF